MANDVFNERTTTIVNAEFYDEDGVLVSPTVARYAVRDLETAADIVAWTGLTIGSGVTDVDIEMTPAQMAVLDARRSHEVHCLTVHFTWGSGREAYDQYLFDVLNLLAAPRP